MKNLLRYAMVVILVIVTAAYGFGQGPGSGPGSSSSSGSTSTSSSSSTSVAPVSSSSSSSSSSGGYYSGSSSRDSGGYSSSSGGGYYGGGGSSHYAPNLEGTSWSSYNAWMDYQRYYYYMQSMYHLNSNYFNRFSRNYEPLATPELIKLTYRKPLKLSLQMLDAVQELEEMLQASESGKQIDKQAVMAKIQEIRELDKQILKDEGLDFLDQRRDKEILKSIHVDKLGLDAVAKLREMVTDLSTQLKNTYSQATPAVISIQSLSQPSFKSMCKEIDKLTRALENSARRM